MRSPLERFSDRVENYVRYRPSYPRQVVEVLKQECGLGFESTVADVGCGPGNLAVLLLPEAAKVFGVEPNREMRMEAERLLADRPNFVAVEGSAEATTLPDQSVDLVTAGQAFHWFKPERARVEFRRILKPGGWVALIWNSRLDDTSPFLREYERLLTECSPEYGVVNHRKIGQETLAEFFGRDPKLRTFPYTQPLDWPGLEGRALSSSYVPLTEPEKSLFLERLREIFDTNEVDGKIGFDYRTEMYVGQL
jgi:ubiquinone/menaquinone biosynthesis C-methylase UbiE